MCQHIFCFNHLPINHQDKLSGMSSFLRIHNKEDLQGIYLHKALSMDQQNLSLCK